MMGKGPRQKSVNIWTILFQNYNPINSQLENTNELVLLMIVK